LGHSALSTAAHAGGFRRDGGGDRLSDLGAIRARSHRPGHTGSPLHHYEQGKTSDHFEITYTYPLHGQTRTATSDVEEETFTHLGATREPKLEIPKYGSLTVRGLGWPPAYYDSVIEPGVSLWPQWFGILFFALFWNGILSVFLYGAYVVPWRMRRLYRTGQVGFGAITHKGTTTGKNRSNYVEYDFFTATGQPGHGKTQVYNQKAFDAAQVRQNVIVLHPAGKVKPSVLYEFGGYRCVE